MNPTDPGRSLSGGGEMQKLLALRRLQDRVFVTIGVLCTVGALLVLAALLVRLCVDGLGQLSWMFLWNEPSRFAGRAGILPAWVGTLAIMTVTGSVAVPVGIAAGIYLEEYSEKNWFTNMIEISISNLAGVPSIIYGLMALGLFVYTFHLGRTVLTGGLTLACLSLPIVIVATRESLRAIPIGIREAAFAMGSSKWEVVRFHLLPYSIGGIATGVIIALSRAIGEAAPLVTIGALAFNTSLPSSPLKSSFPFVSFDWVWSEFTVMPVQVYNWISRPEEAFHANAAAAGLVLLAGTLAMNAVAIVIRFYARRSIKW